MRTALDWLIVGVCGTVVAAFVTFLGVVWALRMLFIPVVVVLLIVVTCSVMGCAAAPKSAYSVFDPAAERHFEALEAARKLDGAHKTMLAFQCPIKPADCEAEYDRLYADFTRASRNP